MRIRKPINVEKEKNTLFMAMVSAALAHPVRIALLNYVSAKNTIRNDVCNKDLVENFNYSQSSMSQHVKKLVEAEVFEVKYEDKFSFYSINKKTLKKYIELMQKF
jgi:ArsR family transcriptional regulator, arsenate/arsenite/antimonite-responsive transcriptional repressor